MPTLLSQRASSGRAAATQGGIYGSSIHVKQCFNCQQFGHVGTQCRASKRCSWCAGAHDLKGCPRPELKQCANCKARGHGAPLTKLSHHEESGTRGSTAAGAAPSNGAMPL